LGFNNPTPHTEDLYIKSVNQTTDDYRVLLEEVRAGTLTLPDRDLDDGSRTEQGEYSLADATYASLLARLAAHHFDKTSARLRDNILEFYAVPSPPEVSGKDRARQLVLLADLSLLKAATPSPVVAPSPDASDKPSIVRP
jgi:hypothetical protein